MIFILIFFFFFIIIGFFAFPQFSPIPYFPSNRKDLLLIIKGLQLKNNQTIIDLGAGDGFVIFELAKKTYERNLNTKFVAVDINPVLLFIMYLRRFFHQNKKNVKIIYGDMFSMNFNSLTRKPVNSLTFYLYISPWYIEKTLNNIKKQFPHFSLVSYMYKVKSMAKKEKKIKGNRHNLYLYTV